MAVESVEAAVAAESSILPGNNQNMDPNTIRSGMDVSALVRVPEELPLVAVAVRGKEKDCMKTGEVDTYRKTEEGQWCNNMQVEGPFGNLVKGVHGGQASTGSYRWDDPRDGGARKF